MNHYVYEITNKVNGKKYIGKRSCSCDISKDKYMGSGKMLKDAQVKYGINNFDKKIIVICETEKEAYKKERELIAQFKAVENQDYYNIRDGGFGFTSEDAKKIWEVAENRNNFINLTKERWKNIDYRNKMINVNKGNKNTLGYKHTDKHKQYIHSKLKGRLISEETKLKISIKNKGKIPHNKGIPMSESQKCILSRIAKERYINKENHPMFGKHHSEETKEKLSLQRTGSKSSLETRTKISNKSKKMWEDKHFREKMSLMRKGKGIGSQNGFSKKVICLNNLMVFDCIKDAKNFVGLKEQSDIGRCCKGVKNSSGKINGEPARWMYFEDYLNNQEK